ncbi:23471_t:CDS:2, partial [Gigaspora margarita]
SQNENEFELDNNPIWLKFYPWLRAKPLTNPSKLYCEWCTEWFKEQYLIQHLNSKDYQKVQKIELHTQLTIHESVKKPLSTEIKSYSKYADYVLD